MQLQSKDALQRTPHSEEEAVNDEVPPNSPQGGRTRTVQEKAWLESYGVAPNALACRLRRGLGEVSVDEVLAVRAGLDALQDAYLGLYRRAVVLAPEYTPPSDAMRRLCLPEHGQLTNADGSWIETRRRIVVALVDVVNDTPTNAPNPFQP